MRSHLSAEFILFASIFFGLSLVTQVGRSAEVDKSKYDLFHPTPREILRPMSTDRPDRTESPISVDAGRVIVETDLASLTLDRSVDGTSETRTRGLGFLVSNVRLGLTHCFELQVIVAPIQTKDVETTALATERAFGFGDLILRMKVNLVGNDSGAIAAALMPFVKLPTNTGGLGHRRIEGGLLIPFGFQMPEGWELGSMLQWNRTKNEANDGFHSDLIATVVLGRDLVGNLATYIELYGQVGDEPGSGVIGTLDLGLTYGLNPDVQFDLGANVGFTPTADDLNVFTGVSLRL